MNPAPRANLTTRLLILLFSACIGASALAADTSWPQREAGATAAGFSEEGIARLDAAMREIVSDQDVAGMVWLLAKDGEVATYESAGLARLDDQAAMTRDSLFRIYSMSKPVTGVALMMLWEEGLWKFDDPISKFIPEFANLDVLVDYDDDGSVELAALDRQPTMRELVNHTAGFGYGLFGDDPVNTAFREQQVLTSSRYRQVNSLNPQIP
ncbi:MAG: serine hydrolase [Proteobacteria bacterium]|nr:serine hydrolase [Pseudomonadota bacterium]